MKNYYLYLLLLVPVIAGVLALLGWGYAFHLIFALSCTVFVWVLPQKELKATAWLIALAFILSIGGDWMLKFKDTIPIRFIYGIGLYFLAHVSYLVFFLKHGKINIISLVVLLAGYGIFFVVSLVPAISDTLLLIAVLLYLIVSCVTLAAVIGVNITSKLSKWLFVAGIVCLVFSDTLIALKEFLGNDTLYFLMMPTFYLSYIFATAAIMRK